MGFYSSVFSSAERDIKDAKAKLATLKREYRNTRFPHVIRMLKLSSKIAEAEREVQEAESTYARLWD